MANSPWAVIRNAQTPIQADTPSVWAPIPEQPMEQSDTRSQNVVNHFGEGPGSPIPPALQSRLSSNPRQEEIQNTQDQLQAVRDRRATHWGMPGNHDTKLGKLAHVFSQVGNIAGNIVAPNVMANIPGTNLNLQEKEAGLTNRLNSELQQGSQEAEQGATTQLHQNQAEAAHITPATEEEANSYGVPVGTPLTAATRAALAKQAGINTSKETIATANNQTKENIAQLTNRVKQEIAEQKPEQRDDRAIRLMMKDPATLTPDDHAYLTAYDKWIQQTKVQPGVARAAAFGQFRPVQVLGPDGQVQYDFSGHAVKTGAATPQSMDFRTAINTMRFMTSGKGGQLATNYRTALDHLDMLQKASDALENGDVQAINRLSNDFKQQFGHAAPTNFEAVKTMLAGELANVAKTTGATDSEIASMKEELSRAQSPEQIKGVIETNHDLMFQKATELSKQYEYGMQGQPFFGAGIPNGHTPAPAANGPADFEYVPGKGLVKNANR